MIEYFKVKIGRYGNRTIKLAFMVTETISGLKIVKVDITRRSMNVIKQSTYKSYIKIRKYNQSYKRLTSDEFQKELAKTDTAIFSCRFSRHGIIADVIKVRWDFAGSPLFVV